MACTDDLEPIWYRQYIRREQQQDPEIGKIIAGLIPADTSCQFYRDDEGLLYKMRTQGEHEDRLVAPATMIDKILKSYHDLPQAGHQGYDKTLAMIKRRFYWKGMAAFVKSYCAK